MIRPSTCNLSRRLAIRNRAETHDSSLARSKYATGNHFVLPSPSQQNDKILKNLKNQNNSKEFALADRYHRDKTGHQENPMKDWLLAKPQRWQTEWVPYIKKKQALENAAREESLRKLKVHQDSEPTQNQGLYYQGRDVKVDSPNFIWENEVAAFNSRMETDFQVNELKNNIANPSDILRTSKFTSTGNTFYKNYVKAITEICFSNLPEKGQKSIAKNIKNSEYIEYQLQHTGVTDFFPNLDSNEEFLNHCNLTLYYLTGKLLEKDPAKKSATKFLQRILLPGLIQKDVLRDLWKLEPKEAQNVLEQVRGDRKIEARLIEQSSGESEIIRVYQVGVYDIETKEFLGSSFGETVWEAEFDACMVALGRILEVERCQYKLYRANLN